MIKLMGMESINILMGLSMMETGKKISNMDLAEKYGLMELNLKENT